MTKTGLIKKLLAATGLEECSIVSTPAEIKDLGKNEKGDPHIDKWSYASVLGMLMYLASNSWLDIVFAVHHCARFTHCTHQSHKKEIKRIVQYLQETKEEGFNIRLNEKLQLDLYAYVDFAGLWNVEQSIVPIYTRS